jgi:hypothetical protein
VHRRSAIILATLFLTAAELLAGYATRDAWIPVVGHAVGYAGRGFYTTVYLTDTSQAMNDVTLSFYAAAQPHVAPRQITLQLAPQQTATVDLGPQLVGDAGATGALHIHSTGRLVATARVYSRGANESPAAEVGATLNAIPSQYAIGTGESTLLHVPAGARYKIYAAETYGFPLYFAVMTMPGSAERRLYLSPNEQRSWDLDELFHGTSATSLQLTGVSGSGKIVVTGTSIAETSQDFAVWEMLLPTEPRHRLRWPELTAYFAVAIALASAAVYRVKAVGSRLSAVSSPGGGPDSREPRADSQ